MEGMEPEMTQRPSMHLVPPSPGQMTPQSPGQPHSPQRMQPMGQFDLGMPLGQYAPQMQLPQMQLPQMQLPQMQLQPPPQPPHTPPTGPHTGTHTPHLGSGSHTPHTGSHTPTMPTSPRGASQSVPVPVQVQQLLMHQRWQQQQVHYAQVQQNSRPDLAYSNPLVQLVMQSTEFDPWGRWSTQQQQQGRQQQQEQQQYQQQQHQQHQQHQEQQQEVGGNTIIRARLLAKRMPPQPEA